MTRSQGCDHKHGSGQTGLTTEGVIETREREG